MGRQWNNEGDDTARTSGAAAALALVLVTGGVMTGTAVADDHGTPARQDVRAARAAVSQTADSVAAVRARLVVAHQELERSAVAAAQARQAAREARQRSRIAEADVRRQRASSIAAEKTALIERLAELQHVSVRLAQRRQSALEQQAAAAAAAQEEPAQQERQEQQDAPDPTPTPTPEPPVPPAPPAPSGGASAAIAFARGQLGGPYRWGAAGPNARDCSGLTMGAWGAGGKTLPHCSVAQYEQSTPNSAGRLQPGDLVFWGSSSDPSSIYHVALYVGGGQIIHAPRAGEDVEQPSMYYWISPTFFARP